MVNKSLNEHVRTRGDVDVVNLGRARLGDVVVVAESWRHLIYKDLAGMGCIC